MQMHEKAVVLKVSVFEMVAIWNARLLLPYELHTCVTTLHYSDSIFLQQPSFKDTNKNTWN